METHRITGKTAKVPATGENATDEKNPGQWKKGKVVRHMEKMELSEDYLCFTRVTTLTDRLTSCNHWK